MTVQLWVSVGELIEGAIPDELLTISDGAESGDVLSNILYNPKSLLTVWTREAFYTEVEILISKKLSLDIPFMSGAEIILGGGVDEFPKFRVRFKSNPFEIVIEEISLTLHFPSTILQEYIREEGSWIKSESVDGYDFEISDLGCSLNNLGDVYIQSPSIENINPARIGNTAFILDLDTVRIISGAIPEDLSDIISPGFKGIYISSVSLFYSKQNSGTRLPGIHLENAMIGSGGFTGKGIAGNINVNPDIDADQLNSESFEVTNLGDRYLTDFQLLGMDLILWHLSISFTKSIPDSGTLTGLLKTGLSDRWFVFRANIGGPNADFMLDIGGTVDAPLVNLEHEYFEIKADSIAYKVDDGVHYAIISGSIRPKIPGFDWPEMKIEDLSVSSEGDISIPGGWIKAPETITLNFSAFKIGIDEIGFGNSEPEPDALDQTIKQWLGFSGELNLVEGLDLKASVDGLKFSWPKGGGPVSTTLKGIAVEFEIPNTLSFKGTLQYEELTDENNRGTGLTGNLFKGNIDLELTSVRLAIEAELIIGKLMDADGNPFTTFFIVLGAELPAGIPLGATGVSLYGVKGLGAMNAGPTKTEEQNWYDWYMAAPERNITSIEKYKPIAGYNAFGAGVTLGTAFDDGFTLNMSVMLAVLLPGPVVILEGKANLLKQRMEGAQNEGGPEGAFYLLAVLDGRAGTFMLNVDVKYSLKDIITVGASLEAFFDFNDSSSWYVYIGRKEPEDKRVRAEILSLFGANTYFMIDNTSFKTGASIGYEFRKKYGPAKVFLVAKIGFDAAIFWQPMQLEGALAMEAGLGVSVFGIGLELYLAILLAGRVPKPYWIYGKGTVAIKLFWPLPDIKFDVELEWEQQAKTQPVWPLLKECNFIHHKGSGINIPILLTKAEEDRPTWEEFPIVPVDARPILTFARPLHNLVRETSIGTNPTFKTTEDNVGGTIFKYNLNSESLALQKYEVDTGEWIDIKKSINQDRDYELPSNNTPPRFIVDRESIINIQDDFDPNEPKIQLWKYSARDNHNDFTREDDFVNHPACSPRMYPQYDYVNWLGVPDGTQYDHTFSYAGLTFILNQSYTDIRPYIRREELVCGDITIHFPEHIYICYIDTIAFQSGEAYFNGTKVGDLGLSDNILGIRGFDPINSIKLKALFKNNEGPIVGESKLRPSIKSITYMKQQAVLTNSDRNDNSPASEEEKIKGQIVLEPASYYRLSIQTSVDVNSSEGANSDHHYAYFRTDNGPGFEEVSADIPSAPNPNLTTALNYSGKPINQLATYIERTLPIDGASNHYLEYDVGIVFNEHYAEKLYGDSKLNIRFKDRNGKLLETSIGDFLSDVSFIPLLSPGLIALLLNKEDGGCAGRSMPAPPAPYLNFSNTLPFKASSLYTAEVFIKNILGDKVIHQFQFTASKYKNFRDHVLGHYKEDTVLPIDLPPQFLEGRLSLRVFSRKIEEYKNNINRFYEVSEDALMQSHLLESLKGSREDIQNSSYELFDKLERKFDQALEQINMTNRPLPERFEIFRVPFINYRTLCYLLIESPEPIDWLRVTAYAETTGSRSRKLPIQFVWNKDKTRAFICRERDGAFSNTKLTFNLTYSGEKDPISGVRLKSGRQVNESASFKNYGSSS